jgi:mono/diheme cytochrome c family protein
VDPDAEMPSFGDRLSEAQLDAISSYLASRR